jgi:hypothetical protein
MSDSGWSSSLNVDALKGWLAGRPPQTLLSYLDRLLTAMVGDLEERRALVARGMEMLTRVNRLISNGTILSEITNALIAVALLHEERIETEKTRVGLLAALPEARLLARSWSEPYRSTFFYWQARAGLGPQMEPGPDPDDELLRLYYTTHRVLFESDYGYWAVPSARYTEELRSCLPVLDQRPDNGDALGEVLLCETILFPRDLSQCEMLGSRLAALQRKDGSITMPSHASPEALHHVACVAVLADRLLRKPPNCR